MGVCGVTMTTTLNRLKAAGACRERYAHLVKSLGGTGFDHDAPISLLTILESNGVEDTLWCLQSGAIEQDVAAPALAEYERVKAPALAEYERVMAPALAEYERVTAPALAEYERVTASARAEYERVKAPALALAEYRRVKAPALAEYRRVTAPALAEYERVTALALKTVLEKIDERVTA